MMNFTGNIEFKPLNTSRVRFTPDEDMMIRNLVLNTTKNWEEIARHLPGRTPRQCRDRYNTYLNKVLVQKDWTEEEDRIIIEKYKEIGPRWVQISNFLKNRGGNNVKNRFYKYISKKFSNLETKASLPRKKKTPAFVNKDLREESLFDDTMYDDILLFSNDFEPVDLYFY